MFCVTHESHAPPYILDPAHCSIYPSATSTFTRNPLVHMTNTSPTKRPSYLAWRRCPVSAFAHRSYYRTSTQSKHRYVNGKRRHQSDRKTYRQVLETISLADKSPVEMQTRCFHTNSSFVERAMACVLSCVNTLEEYIKTSCLLHFYVNSHQCI